LTNSLSYHANICIWMSKNVDYQKYMVKLLLKSGRDHNELIRSARRHHADDFIKKCVKKRNLDVPKATILLGISRFKLSKSSFGSQIAFDVVKQIAMVVWRQRFDAN